MRNEKSVKLKLGIIFILLISLSFILFFKSNFLLNNNIINIETKELGNINLSFIVFISIIFSGTVELLIISNFLVVFIRLSQYRINKIDVYYTYTIYYFVFATISYIILLLFNYYWFIDSMIRLLLLIPYLFLLKKYIVLDEYYKPKKKMLILLVSITLIFNTICGMILLWLSRIN